MSDKPVRQSTDIMDPRSTLALAIEKGIDPATLGRLMDLQERYDAAQARKAYVEAMAGFKRDCPAVIGKDKKADFGTGKAKYSYATTGAIIQAITPALSKWGLSLSWDVTQDAKMVTVTCHVTHSGGHRESCPLTGPHDESGGKNPIQTLGSSVHYLQRYTMVSVLGLATADMDDPDSNPAKPPIAMPTPKPAAKTQAAAKPGESATSNEPIIGTVAALSQKATKKGGTRYGIKIEGRDDWYGTFDDNIGETAREAKELGATVAMDWSRRGEYLDCVGLVIVGHQGAAEAQEEMPI